MGALSRSAAGDGGSVAAAARTARPRAPRARAARGENQIRRAPYHHARSAHCGREVLPPRVGQPRVGMQRPTPGAATRPPCVRGWPRSSRSGSPPLDRHRVRDGSCGFDRCSPGGGRLSMVRPATRPTIPVATARSSAAASTPRWRVGAGESDDTAGTSEGVGGAIDGFDETALMPVASVGTPGGGGTSDAR